MKEKIGTLIELANQYEIEKEKSEGVNVDAYVLFKWGYNNNGLARYDETDRWEGDNLYGDTAAVYLISKSFGMIGWLVENDKIDREKEIKNSELNWLHEHYFREDCLLMLLSISSSPIEDLLSYLK